MQSPREAARTSPIVWVAALGVLPYLISELFRFFAAPLGWDQSWLLYAAQHMLSGTQLYGPHLQETNPPAIIWFSALPILLSNALHLHPALALRLLTLVIILLSIAWCLRLSRPDKRSSDTNFLWLLACVLLLVAFAIGVDDFAQREQLFVFLALPYIVATSAAVLKQLSTAERISLGLIAGLSCCLKPQECLVFVALEIYLAIKNRSLRRCLAPELFTLLCTGALYVLLVRLITPLYFRDIVPLLVNTYWAFGEGTALVLALHVKRSIAEFLLALLAYLVLRRHLKLPQTVPSLLAASGGAFLAYCVQHTHWPYHRYPFEAFLEVGCAYLFLGPAATLLDLLRRKPRLELSLAVLTLVPVALYTPTAVRNIRSPQNTPLPGSAELNRFFDAYKSGQTVSVLSTSVTPFSEIFAHKLRWGSRFPHLWMLPAIIRNESGPNPASAPFKRLSPETIQSLSTLQRTESAEDLNYWQPSVVLIERCTAASDCQGIHGRNFDILRWFLQSPQFSTAWAHYQPGANSLSKYDVYVRTR